MEQREKNLNSENENRKYYENEQQKHTDNWEMLALKVLEASRQELFLAMRYMFEPLNMLEFQKNMQIKFLACDGKKMYYNPMLLCNVYRNSPVEVNRGFLHVIFHCLFRNIYHCDGKEPEIWDLASDIMAEYLIDSIELSCVQRVENAERIKVYKRLEKECNIMSAQNIYYALKRNFRGEIDKMSASGMFYSDDHRYWRQNDNDNDNKDKENNRSENGDDDSKDWEEAAKKMESSLGLFGQGRGDSRGNLKKTLAGTNRKQISYRDFLRKFAVIKENMSIDMDAFDYGFYNYGLQQFGNMPLIEELEYKEEQGIEDFVIVLDTSGSCAYELISKFINATFDIIGTTDSFFEKMNIHIIQCDNEIQEDTVITSLKDVSEFKKNFTVKGFGGTDFRPAFYYINSLRQQGQLKKLKGVLYFTDGYGIYPTVKPVYDTAFVFMGGYDEKRKVPGWAIRVDLDEEQLTDRIIV